MKQLTLDGRTVEDRAKEPDWGRPWPNDFTSGGRRFKRRWQGGDGW